MKWMSGSTKRQCDRSLRRTGPLHWIRGRAALTPRGGLLQTVCAVARAMLDDHVRIGQFNYRAIGQARPRSYNIMPATPAFSALSSRLNLKFTGLTQNLGQLSGSYRDFQSNFWANLRILGQTL